MIAPILALFLVAQTPPMPALGALESVPTDNSATAYLAAEAAAKEVNAVLDRMHDAASRADGETYFAQFDTGARFIGTDATERWDIATFRAYAEPFFARGQGWTYRPRPDRALQIMGDTVIFDELLDNDSYGLVRGSGVVMRTANGWKIQQYVLSYAVPNAVAKDVTALIRTHETPVSAAPAP
ncbi:nuclear transport factor 2 family protein [soil metagenome]